MRLRRSVIAKLVVFAVVSVVAAWIMAIDYVKLPAMFGIGRYTVTMELAKTGGLYPTGNVTYRGSQVGKVRSVQLTDDGTVAAVLSLNSGTAIPSNLKAEVHSQSAVGEQYVLLLPQDETSPPLKNGDVIPLKDTTVPPDIDTLLDATDRGLNAIPHDSLKTAIDESYTAVGGLGPELSRIVKGASAIAIDARANLESLTTLIDGAAPILDTQTGTADSIQAWSSHLAEITGQLRRNDTALAGVIDNGGAAADEGRQLLERLQPTLPVILANLVSIGKVGIAYGNGIEQLLVLIPHGVETAAAGSVPNLNTKQSYKAGYLDFNLNINLPPSCTTGFLPASQRRVPTQIDTPDRPEGDLYCRIPQDAPQNVRGARNIPCETVPGKRAPTVKMCESSEQYVPLNDGTNWKGDPNATLSGQDIPQLAVVPYDPATGSYVGPDGQVHTQSDLAQGGAGPKSWQDLVVPQQ